MILHLAGTIDDKRFGVLFTGLAILSLFFLSSVSLAQSPVPGNYEEQKPKKLTKEEYERQMIEKILFQIEQLHARVPPDYKGMADLYMILFREFPQTTQGKMSAWEAFELYRKAKKWNGATAALASILSVYGYRETLDNPLDETKPVFLRATARVELARLYAQKGDLLTAIEIARSIPNQHPGVIVGMFSGDKTYYGRVEVICGLDSVKYSLLTRKHNQATLLLLDLLRDYPKEKIGRIHGEESVQPAIAKMSRDIVVSMPAGESKKIVTYQELEKLCDDRLALARLLIYKAQVYEESYKTLFSTQRIEDALNQYRALIKKYPEVVDHSPAGQMPMAVAALRHIRILFTEKKHDNTRALYELSTIAIKASKLDDPASRAIAAYARFYSGMTHYQNMKNPQQAAYDFELLLKRYPEVWEYPSPNATETKPKLADFVKKVLKRVTIERY